MEKEFKSALDARRLTEQSADKNYENALNHIKTQAEQGFSECLLFCYLSFENVKKLMEFGFSVSEIIHPLEQRKMQKISW